MKFEEAIGRLQTTLNKGIASDDARYPDRYIASLLKTMRSKRLKQLLKKFMYISPFNYNTIECLPLELGKFSDCPCFTNDCYILRSKVELPKILSGRNQLAIQGVYTIAGEKISETTKTADKYKDYTKTKSDKLGYFIYNNRLYITGSTKLKVVTLTALLTDPEELLYIDACETDGTSTGDPCYNPKLDEYPLDEDLYEDVEDMIIAKVFKTIETREEDNENNSKDTEVTSERE